MMTTNYSPAHAGAPTASPDDPQPDANACRLIPASPDGDSAQHPANPNQPAGVSPRLTPTKSPNNPQPDANACRLIPASSDGDSAQHPANPNQPAGVSPRLTPTAYPDNPQPDANACRLIPTDTLTYTYLGDWISRRRQNIAAGIDGAQVRLAAAETLKKRLELILEGEALYDIFVRWKPLHEQPIGWNPDINDGVRLNIRPFLSVPDVKKKGAGLLLERTYPSSSGWGRDEKITNFADERYIDYHYTLKLKTRQKARNHQ